MFKNTESTTPVGCWRNIPWLLKKSVIGISCWLRSSRGLVSPLTSPKLSRPLRRTPRSVLKRVRVQRLEVQPCIIGTERLPARLMEQLFGAERLLVEFLAGTRRRAEQLYQQLDMLQHLRQQARRELLAESRKHAITAKLRQIPSLGPIRSALAVALIQTPHRFRNKRQLWT